MWFVSVCIFRWEYMNKICDTIHLYSVSSFPQTTTCWSYTAVLFSATALQEGTGAKNKLNLCTMTKHLGMLSQWDPLTDYLNKFSPERDVASNTEQFPHYCIVCGENTGITTAVSELTLF